MTTVAIDLRMVGPRPHGIARYAQALWEELPARSNRRYLALVSPAGRSTVAARRPGDRVVTARSRFLSPLEQVELPLLLARERVDVLHATSFSIPALWRGPLVVTLHDLTHLAFPELHGPGRRAYYRAVVGPGARRAARVLTVSAFERGRIARWLGVRPERIAVTPNAVRRPAHLSARAPTPRLLYVGNGKPHKNVQVAVDAVRRLADPPELWLAGEGLERFAGGSVRALGPVDEAALWRLYAEAWLFLFPSRSEGFGLPPVEAAASGTPVLVGDSPGLREIWDGVAPLLPLDDAGVWAREIRRLLADAGAREALARRCAAQAARYTSWRPLIEAAEAAYGDAEER